MLPFAAAEFEELFSDLIHDLRQPLNVIENTTSYLKLLLNDSEEPVREQLRLIERQVDLAARLLAEASTWVNHPEPIRRQRTGGANLELTKSQSSAVT